MYNNFDIAERIKGLREMENISAHEMAKETMLSVESYLEFEQGQKDFSFSFLHSVANKLGIDLYSLATGEDAKLAHYAVERENEGLSIARRQGFNYLHKGARLKNRMMEPFVVTVPYIDGAENSDIPVSMHKGQEMDFILSGTLKVLIGDKSETLCEGDSIIYDSSTPHGMIALGGKECRFIAILTEKH